MTPVSGMSWIKWYDGTQLWAEPDVKQASDYMKYAYYNREDAKNKGLCLKNYIKSRFGWDKVTSDMIEHIRRF
jgi:hypothetical protein